MNAAASAGQTHCRKLLVFDIIVDAKQAALNGHGSLDFAFFGLAC